jgi:phenylacetate-coenzyme A ligase PaaK-like adenylate-forming protein
MGMVEGRVDDTLTFSDGTEVSAAMLERIVRAVPGVARFQFRQISRDALQLLVVADHRFTEASLKQLRGTQEQFVLEAGIRIDIDPVLVDEIEVLPNGKHQAVVRLDAATQGSPA